MLTTNFNVVQVSIRDKEKYEIGDIFIVPDSDRHNLRFMKFDGLKIKNITFGFGCFLHFDYEKWEKSIPQLDIKRPWISDNQPKKSYLVF